MAMARRENATHAFVIRTTDRTLCTPVPPANVSAWDAVRAATTTSSRAVRLRMPIRHVQPIAPSPLQCYLPSATRVPMPHARFAVDDVGAMLAQRPLNTYVHPQVFERALAAAACTRNADTADHTVDGMARFTTIPSPAADAPFDYRTLRSVHIDNG